MRHLELREVKQHFQRHIVNRNGRVHRPLSLLSRRAHTLHHYAGIEEWWGWAVCSQSGEGRAAGLPEARSAKMQTSEGILKYQKEVRVLPLKSVSLVLNHSEVKICVCFLRINPKLNKQTINM